MNASAKYVRYYYCAKCIIHTFDKEKTHAYIHTYIYRVSQEECARLQEGVPYVKVY